MWQHGVVIGCELRGALVKGIPMMGIQGAARPTLETLGSRETSATAMCVHLWVG